MGSNPIDSSVNLYIWGLTIGEKWVNVCFYGVGPLIDNCKKGDRNLFTIIVDGEG